VDERLIDELEGRVQDEDQQLTGQEGCSSS